MKKKKENNRPLLITQPTLINTERGKSIQEYVGIVNTRTRQISIAHMDAPGGWSEPGQCPEFDEYTLVLRGSLRIEWKDGYVDVESGQAIICPKGMWVRYSSTSSLGARYISVCLPAFSLQAANRDSK